MPRPSPVRSVGIALVFWVASFACATAQQAQPNEPPKPATDATADSDTSETVRLGAGDLLDVSVYNVPELATKTRVGSNGDVYLPLVDYVHLAGLTIDEAQEVIEKRLADGGFVNSPHVTVFVNEYASQNATILGEVLKPGQYTVLGQPRLFDIISTAGGFTERAARRVTITHRVTDDKPVSLQLARNVNDDPSKNIEIHAGDTIVVQRADVVYVVGDVGRPSGFVMDSDLTVLKAIALAGGANRTAKLSDTRIIRKGPQGMQETRVELNKMLRAKAADIAMQPDDILFVPVNGGKIAAGHVAQAALQAATAVSVVALVP